MLTIAALIAVVAAVMLDAIRGRMMVRWAAWIEARFGSRLVREGLAASRLGNSPSIQNGLGDLAKIQTFVARYASTWLDVFWAPLFIVGVYLVHPLLGGIAAAAVLLLAAARLDAGGDDPQRPGRRARGLRRGRRAHAVRRAGISRLSAPML